VNIGFLGKKSDDEIAGLAAASGCALAVVNTRAHARRLFEAVQSDAKYHLSTLMTPAHRAEVVGAVRSALRAEKPCILVSTQIVECGVDLDFAAVFRSITGVDSIVQAAGRCNREGKRGVSDVYVFEPEDKCNDKESRLKQEFMRKILKTCRDLSDIDATERYFAEYYQYYGRDSDKMEIGQMFEMPVKNGKCRLDFRFAECAEKFSYIEPEPKADIIVPDGGAAAELAERARRFAQTGGKYGGLLRKLQPHTVSVYAYEADKLSGAGAAERIAAGVYILTDLSYYKNDVGLDVPNLGEAQFCNC
jgi:hypothetical protein